MKTDTYQPFPFIFFLAAVYSLGIVIAYSHQLSPLLLCLVVLLSLSSWTLCLFLRIELKGYIHILFPLLIFLQLGMFFTAIKTSSLQGSLLRKSAEANRSIDIYGVVKGESETARGFVGFTLKVDQIEVGERRYRISELTKVTAKTNDDKSISFGGGERVKLVQVIPIMPSSEKFRKRLYNQEIQTLLLIEPSHLKVLDQATFVPRMLSFIRKEVKNRILTFLDREEAALLLGIMLGNKADISPLTQREFARAGVAHVMAVSGLHMGMMVLICFWLAGLLKLKVGQKYGLTVGFVVFYALISGCRPSVLRAALIIGIGVIGWTMGKGKNLIALLSAAALVLLLYNPFFLFDVAFQLSFAATLAIAVIAPVLNYQFGQFSIFSRRMPKLFLTSVAVQTGVVPIIMYHFGELSMISALANILVVPLIAPVLSLGLLGSSVSFISSFLAYPWFMIVGFLLGFIEGTVSFLAGFSFSSFSAGISLKAAFLYYSSLVVLVVWIRQRKALLSTAALLFTSLIIPIVLIWWQVLASAPPAQFTASFFDVGQGDSAAVRSPSGACILIDGGQDRHKLKSLLFSAGIRKIDLLILSHSHADHLNGLIELVEGYNIGLVLIGGAADNSPQYREFQVAIQEGHIPYLVAKEGMQLEVGPDLELIVLSDSDTVSAASDLNNESVVVKLKYEDLSLLFPGDIENEAELELLDWKQELQSSILKVSHHGSSTSADKTFLKYVEPKVAVISVGKDNRFGHPASSTRRILKSLGAKIYRTDRDGNVTITSDGQDFRVKSSK